MVGQSSRVQKGLGTSVKFFFYPKCTFIRAYYVHCSTYILAPVFIYFLLDSGGGGEGSYKVLAASPQPEDSES
jgi:hypothetical protein